VPQGARGSRGAKRDEIRERPEELSKGAGPAYYKKKNTA